MIEITDNTIVITDEDGNEELFKILFYYENTDRNKTFYFIYKDEAPDELTVIASSDGKTLEIPTEEEYDEAEEVFETYQDDPTIQEIK